MRQRQSHGVASQWQEAQEAQEAREKVVTSAWEPPGFLEQATNGDAGAFFILSPTSSKVSSPKKCFMPPLKSIASFQPMPLGPPSLG